MSIDNLMGERVDIEEMDLSDLIALRQDYLTMLGPHRHFIIGPVRLMEDDLREIEREIVWKTRVL